MSIDVNHLAKLARIRLAPEEAAKLEGELSSVLSYVGEIQNAKLEKPGDEKPMLRNVMREDSETYERSVFKERLLEETPHKEGGYVKVKKIL
jgi:aspartyl/glutamyl-tRNA(Asn/Gln) amidotransferase C subunit